MLDRFKEIIDQRSLCTMKDRVLLAVSGGKDSMVMLNLFHQAGYSIGVAHCNFQLRGAEADSDEAFVHKVCEELKVPYYSTRFDTNNYAVSHGLSIQMAARNLRYDWFRQLVQNEKWKYLATAHHLNDNMETVLMNFVRGTGLDGLNGIPRKTGYIIRPLLDFTREEIDDYALATKLQWQEDVSNATVAYDRNFLRLEVIPKLKTLNPALEKTFARNLERVSGANELFKSGFSQLEKELIREFQNQVQVEKKRLLTLENPVPILWHLIKSYGFNYEQCEGIINSLTGEPGRKFYSPHYQLTLDRDAIIISEIEQEWQVQSLEEGSNEASLGSLHLKWERVMTSAFNSDSSEAVIDATRLAYPLIWRKWKSGDFFYPLGMNHRKKLSDFFIDNKLSLADKNSATVIESAGEIVWVVGYRIDERYKVDDSTKEVLHFKLNRHFG